MCKKIILLMAFTGLYGCTLLSIPVAVVETAAGVVKIPITVVGKVVDAVNDDDKEGEED